MVKKLKNKKCNSKFVLGYNDKERLERLVNDKTNEEKKIFFKL